eukprot:gene13407-13535_t
MGLLQVVAAVRQWCQQGFTWVVRGNHDDAALAARRQLDRQQGPLKPKYHWVEQMTAEDVHFLQELPFSLQVQGFNIAVVHAGLVPGRPLQEQQLKDLYKMRDVQPAASSSGSVMSTAGGGHMCFEMVPGNGLCLQYDVSTRNMPLEPAAHV